MLVNIFACVCGRQYLSRSIPNVMLINELIKQSFTNFELQHINPRCTDLKEACQESNNDLIGFFM